MPERDLLESGLYKEAMDDVRFSEDFEQRTVEMLMSKLSPDKKTRRPQRWAAGLSAVAAVALVSLIGTQMSRQNLTPAMDANLAAVQPTSVPGMVQEEVAMDAAESMVAEYAYDGGFTGAAPSAVFVDDQSAAPGGAVYLELPQTAECSHIQENSFRDAATEPLSTFAADVDTASYANARQYLASGTLPSADLVRTEEFLNYFNYDYPQPAGDEPFSVTTEVAACPWNEDNALMLVGLKAKDIDAALLPPSNLVFLIDVSGSMDMEDKLPLAQSAFRMLVEQLRPEDRVSIVTYAGSDSVLIDGATGEDKMRIAQVLDSLFAGGSTDGASGIQTAYGLAQKHFIRGGNNRVILATDGDLNVGLTSEGELTRLIEDKRQSGVFLSVMGFGQDNLKDNKLETLADHGNGNYSYIDSRLEAKKVLVEELGGTFFTVAKDVKLQVEFNPAVVKSYRLIGYENRTMAAQDFADDTKDGGELGAGHTVTALYELVPSDGQGSASNLKYQTATDTGSSDYATVSIRAKKPDGDVSQAYSYPVGQDKFSAAPCANMRFASAVAEVCLLLRDSEYRGSASYQSAAELLDGIEGITKDPYKDEFAYIVRQLARKG